MTETHNKISIQSIYRIWYTDIAEAQCKSVLFIESNCQILCGFTSSSCAFGQNDRTEVSKSPKKMPHGIHGNYPHGPVILGCMMVWLFIGNQFRQHVSLPSDKTSEPLLLRLYEVTALSLMISDRLNKLIIFNKLQPTKDLQSRTHHMVTWYIHMVMSYRTRDFLVQNPHWVGCPYLECQNDHLSNRVLAFLSFNILLFSFLYIVVWLVYEGRLILTQYLSHDQEVKSYSNEFTWVQIAIQIAFIFVFYKASIISILTSTQLYNVASRAKFWRGSSWAFLKQSTWRHLVSALHRLCRFMFEAQNFDIFQSFRASLHFLAKSFQCVAQILQLAIR